MTHSGLDGWKFPILGTHLNMKKPKYLAIVLILILFSLAFAGCRGSGAVASSWPGITVDENTAYVAFNRSVYTLDLENDGRVTETLPANVDELRPRNPMFYHAPVLLDESTLLVGSYNNRMFTINLNTGNADDFFISARNRWIAQPLQEDGTIFAPNANGTLYALALNGSEKWSFETNATIWATPVYDDNRIYMVSQDHSLYALNAASGDLIWTLDLGAASVNSPVLDEDGILYIGTFGSKVFAIDSDRGSILWEVETLDWVWGGPVLGPDGIIYVTDLGANLYAIDTETQEIVWEKQVDPASSITGSPLLLGESLIVVTQSGVIASYDLNGERLWKEEFATEDNPVEFHGTPVLAGEDTILVSSLGSDAAVFAFNPELELLWMFEPGN